MLVLHRFENYKCDSTLFSLKPNLKVGCEKRIAIWKCFSDLSNQTHHYKFQISNFLPRDCSLTLHICHVIIFKLPLDSIYVLCTSLGKCHYVHKCSNYY